MKTKIGFSSKLALEYRDDLETLLFFNPLQKRLMSRIQNSIRDYGVPMIIEDRDWLRVKVEGLPGVQTLYAMDAPAIPAGKAQLAGVMIYSRIDTASMALIHVAVKEQYSFTGGGEAMLVPAFVDRLRQIGKALRGVQFIQLKYASDLTLPV